MKRSRITLTAAWFLLFCFIAGQVIVYSHQHHILKNTVTHSHDTRDISKNVITEKCQMCDSMHHVNMLLEQNQYACALQSTPVLQPHVVFNFKSFGLILSDGLSPPAFIIA